MATTTADADCKPGHARLKLDEAVKEMMLEGRSLMPGVQALFGFQLLGAFNQRFDTAFSAPEKGLHLVALALSGLAAALLMTPAAYNRQTDPFDVSEKLLRVGSRLILAALPCLGLAMSLDFYLVARLITHSLPVAVGLAVTMGLVLAALWGVLPRSRRLRRLLGG